MARRSISEGSQKGQVPAGALKADKKARAAEQRTAKKAKAAADKKEVDDWAARQRASQKPPVTQKEKDQEIAKQARAQGYTGVRVKDGVVSFKGVTDAPKGERKC